MRHVSAISRYPIFIDFRRLTGCRRDPRVLGRHNYEFYLGYVNMHATSLVHIQQTTYPEYSLSQLALGKQPSISQLRIFGCAVYVRIPSTQRTKMGPQ